MFALMSYEGDKGRTAPDSINNYFAYKTMKADAGYGMASADENSFVNEKETAFSAEAYNRMKCLGRIIKVKSHFTVILFNNIFYTTHTESMKLWIRFFSW